MALTKVTGSVIKDNVSLSGNVSVGGTLTYQDVTNVDALGIGTFRTGIKVLAGQVDVGSNIKLGNAGVITATSFVGSGANLTSLPSAQLTGALPAIDGSNLTGIAADKIFEGNTEAEVVDTGSDGHFKVTTEGSERLRITSTGAIGIGTNNPISGAAGARLAVHLDDNTSYAGGTARGNGIIVYNRNAGGHSSLELAQRNSANTYGTVILNAVDPADGNDYGADFTIQTRATGSGNYGERLRIASDGDVGIGTNSPVDRVHIHRSSATGPFLYITNTSTGVSASDGIQIGYDGSNTAVLKNNESTDMVFYANSSEKLRIHSNGDISCGGAADNNIYNDSSGGGLNFKNGGQLVISKQASSAADPLVWLNDTGQTTNKFLLFAQDGTEKASIGLAGNDLRFARDGYNETLRIDSSGRLLKSGQATLTSTSLSHPIQVAADSSAQNIVLFGRASDDISAIDFYEADKSTRLGEIQYRTNELNIRHRTAGADVIFSTTPSGGSLGERLRILSNGNTEFNGQRHRFSHSNSGGVGAFLSLRNTGSAVGSTTGIVFGIGTSNADLDGSDYGEGQIKVDNDSGGFGNMHFNLHVNANRSFMKIVGNGQGETGAGSGTEGMRGGVAFGNAGIAIDRSWTGQPGIHVFNQNVEGDTDQGTFRFHGWNRSYASYPGSSGADFGVNVTGDGSGFSSDERKKTGIKTITNALNTVAQLRGVSYKFVNSELNPQTHMTMDSGTKLGFVAQEVIPLLPSIVIDAGGEKAVPHENGWCDRYCIDYGSVTPLLAEAIKELKAKNEALEARLAALEGN